MKKNLALVFALIGWFAVVAQYVLMVENRTVSFSETTIRFFSFFTILTNTLVAAYFTFIVFANNKNYAPITKPGILTAITIYITMVGLVYQVVLRHVWQPKGLQLIVDELLHSVIPVLVIFFWFLYEVTKPIKNSQVLKWASYPLLYLAFILIRGSFSGFYPYPFVDVTSLGITKALINAAVLLLVFMVISALFIFIGKALIKR